MTIIVVEMMGVVAIAVRILIRVMMRFVGANRSDRNWEFINIDDPEEVSSRKYFSLPKLYLHKTGSSP